MKIDFNLIHEGISYGIPEGTNVPEKPKYKQQCETRKINSIECDTAGGECTCEIDWQTYNADLQALLSESIQWEDQEVVKQIIMSELPGPPPNGKFVDGIYPLLGVNAVPVHQYRYLTYPNKPISQWFDGSPSISSKGDLKKSRVILRLVPQPNSEQKKELKHRTLKYTPSGVCYNCLNGAHKICSNEKCECRKRKHDDSEWWVEGTEVSDPTACENDDCVITGKCCYHECVAGLTINQKILKEGEIMELPTLEEMREDCPGITLQDYEEMKIEWNKQLKKQVFGVDEKKEPETRLCHCHRNRKVCNGDWVTCHRGVSEGEPTQEEIWMEALKYLRHTLGGYSTTIHQARGLAELFHIQKLKQ